MSRSSNRTICISLIDKKKFLLLLLVNKYFFVSDTDCHDFDFGSEKNKFVSF